MEARLSPLQSIYHNKINQTYLYCWTQNNADFANPLSALVFRHKSASYFMNSLRA